MLITKECDYAVRVLRSLSKSLISSVQSISTEESIPVQYAYQICRKLTKSGILKSHRGADGGYEMLKSPDDLTMLDVVLALETNFTVSDCTRFGSQCIRNTAEHPCGFHLELCRIQNTIMNEMRSKKLSELF